MRVSDYLVQKLLDTGIERAFILTGGGAMHLNDALARNKFIKSTYMHHEQALAMAAEGYARVTGKAAVVNVTSGPGGINALNGVFGAFVDSVSMVIVSGQSRTETIAALHNESLRQLGDQEANMFSITRSVVKYFAMPQNKYESLSAIDKALLMLEEGRPGPIWIDIPINVQGIALTPTEIENSSTYSVKPVLEAIHPNTKDNNPNTATIKDNVKQTIDLLSLSKRPVFFGGNGISLSGQRETFLNILSKTKIPAVTGWNAHDLLPNNHPSYSGKPGTVGDRPGNFVIRSADLVIVLGCRLNIRQISYNWESFAPNAKIIMVDIDKYELSKPTLKLAKKFHHDLKDFLKALNQEINSWKPQRSHKKFLAWCKTKVLEYPVVEEKHFVNQTLINPYAFFKELYHCVKSDDVMVLGNGSACVMGYQSAVIKKGLRLFTNSGSASMGYALPAAIGASLARSNGMSRVICVTGDGSIMMNLQELATINFNKLPIKIFIMDNGGYHSIRQTQMNHFPDNSSGTSANDGLGFPNFIKIAQAFEIGSTNLESISNLKKALKSEDYLNSEPHIFLLKLDTNQHFEPKLQSRKLPDGSMTSPELHDMAPFLSSKELKENILENDDEE